MYRTVDACFWTDPKVRTIPPDAKLLALYLITNPHSHVGGIYYLPDSVVQAETGLSGRGIDTLWDTLSTLGFCRRDKKTQVVWVVKMFFYQGRGEKNNASVGKHLHNLHNSFLINDFLTVYPEVKKHFKDRVSIGYPALDLVGSQEQEQEQEKECNAPQAATHTKSRFTPPTADEVAAYCRERKNGIDANRFVDFYASKSWMVGKNKMSDWKAAVRNWERNNTANPATDDEEEDRVYAN